MCYNANALIVKFTAGCRSLWIGEPETNEQL